MKVTRAPCRTNLDDRVGKLKIAERFGDMITADQKVLIDDHESRLHHKYAVARPGNSTDSKLSEPKQSKQNQISPDENPRSICTDSSPEFVQAREEMSWNFGRSTHHRAGTDGTAEQSCTTSERRNFGSIG